MGKDQSTRRQAKLQGRQRRPKGELCRLFLSDLFPLRFSRQMFEERHDGYLSNVYGCAQQE